MDLVYSQAYSEYKAGMRYYMNNEDNMLIQENNRQFELFSKIEELIMQHYIVPDSDNNSIMLPPTQIANEIFAGTKHVPTEADIRKVGNYLSKHGFKQTSKRVNGKFMRLWKVTRVKH
jgi:predicted P-loop ATPase